MLWSTAAWAVLAGLAPTIDGDPLAWPGARAYLDGHAARPGGGLARNAIRTLERAGMS